VFARIRSSLSYANVMATIAVFLALGGGAYAAIDLVGKNDIKSKHIAKGAVKSVDAKNEGLTGTDISGLTGADIDESSLGKVAAAGAADAAGVAGSALNVNGLELRSFQYTEGDTGASSEKQILSLGGLVLSAVCQPGGITNVNARTNTDDSYIRSSVGGTSFSSNFDTGGFIVVDPPEDGTAFVVYRRGPAGVGDTSESAPTVTATFAVEDAASPDCILAGTAIGRP
jgi:hypothetical protein